MLSLEDRIDLLEGDLTATPMRISAYRDLPFAILRYDPGDEWKVRDLARLLVTRLENAGRRVHVVSLADLLWEAIDASEGIDAVATLERSRGFAAAQEQVATYLSDEDWHPLPDALAARLQGLDSKRDVVFLMHAAAMAPTVYHMSKLLDEMHGRTLVPVILFYPGSLEGTTGLTFMNLPGREAIGNYRVRIYG